MRYFFSLIVLFFFTYSLAEDNIPAGFSHLYNKQVLYASAFFHGSNLGLYQVQVSPEKVKVDDVDKLLSNLPVKGDKVGVLRMLLDKELPANSDALCRYQKRYKNIKTKRKRKGLVCQAIDPKVIELVYDPERFKLFVFINPAYLKKTNFASSTYLKDSNSGLAWVNGSNYISSSFLSRERQTQQINNNGHITKGNSGLFYSNTISNDYFDANENKRYFSSQFDNFYYNYYKNKYHYQAGYLNLLGYYFMPNVEVVGALWGTNTNLITNKGDINAAPISIYLPLAGLVSIYRGTKLLSSRFYQAGSQVLNTSALPSGSYMIRIFTNAGSPQQAEQEVMYTSSTFLPPFRHPQYRLAAGYVEDVSDSTRNYLFSPVSSKDWYIQGSWSYRMAPRWGLKSMAAVADHRQYLLQTGMLHVATQADTSVMFMVGPRNSYGVNLRSGYQRYGFSNQLGLMNVWSSNKRIDNLYDPYFNDNNPFSQVLVQQFMVNDFISKSWNSWILSLSGTYQEATSGEHRYVYGPSLMQTSHLGSHLNMRTKLTYSRNDFGWNVMANVNFSLRGRGQYLSVNNGYAHQLGENSYEGGANYSIVKSNKHGSSAVAQVSANKTPVDLLYRTGASVQTKSIAARGQWQQNTSLDNKFTNYSYTAHVNSGFALSSQAMILGISRIGRSGVIVKVAGGDRSDKFNVLVDGGVKGYVDGGGAVYLRVKPFVKHSVEISQQNTDSLLEYDSGSRLVLLRPGNVQTLIFKVKRKIFVYGIMHDSKHHRLSHAYIKNSIDYATTDSEGYFNAEVLMKDLFLIVKKGRHICMVELPEKGSSPYLDLGEDVRCKM